LPPLKKRKEKNMENQMEIVKWDRYFALYDQGELVCVTVYKKGAQEVKRRLEQLKSMIEEAQRHLQNEEAVLNKIQ
jgi:ArsR family metal-binding transcriptional regulator